MKKTAVIFMAILFLPSPGYAERVLLDDSLEQTCQEQVASRTRSGGQCTEQGWRTRGQNTRLVYELPHRIDCGRLEVEVTTIDPVNQYNHIRGDDNYVNIVGIYEGDHGNHWTAAHNDETAMAVQVTSEGSFRDERFKFKAGACSWDYEDCEGGNRYLPPQRQQGIDWNLGHHYVMVFEWDRDEVNSYVRGDAGQWHGQTSWSWHQGHPDPRPGLSHIFIGRDRNGSGGWIDGATFIRVTLTEDETCRSTCGNSRCDSGEDACGCPSDCTEQCCIDGTVRAAGEHEPNDGCHQCDPERDQTSWSPLRDGSPCDDGDSCTGSDHCEAGICIGTSGACVDADAPDGGGWTEHDGRDTTGPDDPVDPERRADPTEDPRGDLEVNQTDGVSESPHPDRERTEIDDAWDDGSQQPHLGSATGGCGCVVFPSIERAGGAAAPPGKAISILLGLFMILFRRRLVTR